MANSKLLPRNLNKKHTLFSIVSVVSYIIYAVILLHTIGKFTMGNFK